MAVSYSSEVAVCYSPEVAICFLENIEVVIRILFGSLVGGCNLWKEQRCFFFFFFEVVQKNNQNFI